MKLKSLALALVFVFGTFGLAAQSINGQNFPAIPGVGNVYLSPPLRLPDPPPAPDWFLPVGVTMVVVSSSLIAPPLVIVYGSAGTLYLIWTDVGWLLSETPPNPYADTNLGLGSPPGIF